MSLHQTFKLFESLAEQDRERAARLAEGNKAAPPAVQELEVQSEHEEKRSTDEPTPVPSAPASAPAPASEPAQSTETHGETPSSTAEPSGDAPTAGAAAPLDPHSDTAKVYAWLLIICSKIWMLIDTTVQDFGVSEVFLLLFLRN